MNRETLAAINAILALSQMMNDRSLLKEMTDARNSAVAEQAKLQNLQEQRTALARERSQFEAERESLQSDRDKLAKDRAELDRELDRHKDRVANFDNDRQQYDSAIAELHRFRQAVA